MLVVTSCSAHVLPRPAALSRANNCVATQFCRVQRRSSQRAAHWHTEHIAKAAQEGVEQSSNIPPPADCSDAREAIRIGRDVFSAGKYQDAADYFEKVHHILTVNTT